MKKPACPKCMKSDQVVKIIYGLPDWELYQNANLEEIQIGGCFVHPDNPKYECHSAKRNFKC